ncbi:MAG: BolA family transcriptional regulator [SAR324 cluster bacterium]|nr:BolA family transcriptional regulator [SAR324 cluster bacterium]
MRIIDVSTQKIEELLKKRFPDAKIDLVDQKGDGSHLSVCVISKEFISQSLVEQHKMVYQALGDIFRDRVHALNVITRAP